MPLRTEAPQCLPMTHGVLERGEVVDLLPEVISVPSGHSSHAYHGEGRSVPHVVGGYVAAGYIHRRSDRRDAVAQSTTLHAMGSVIYVCEGCGDRLHPTDEVRAVYRELADVTGGDNVVTPRWAYTHLGHEPQGTGYRIIGRGLLSDLERERQSKET